MVATNLNPIPTNLSPPAPTHSHPPSTPRTPSPPIYTSQILTVIHERTTIAPVHRQTTINLLSPLSSSSSRPPPPPTAGEEILDPSHPTKNWTNPPKKYTLPTTTFDLPSLTAHRLWRILGKNAEGVVPSNKRK